MLLPGCTPIKHQPPLSIFTPTPPGDPVRCRFPSHTSPMQGSSRLLGLRCLSFRSVASPSAKASPSLSSPHPPLPPEGGRSSAAQRVPRFHRVGVGWEEAAPAGYGVELSLASEK